MYPPRVPLYFELCPCGVMQTRYVLGVNRAIEMLHQTLARPIGRLFTFTPVLFFFSPSTLISRCFTPIPFSIHYYFPLSRDERSFFSLECRLGTILPLYRLDVSARNIDRTSEICPIPAVYGTQRGTAASCSGPKTPELIASHLTCQT